ncbi:MAG: MBL fold metallo-hydrolase, partial [Gemmatimonadota bacterium]
MTDGPLEIQTFTSRVFGQNAYLVRCRDGDDWLAVDPGGEAQSMAAAIESSGGRLDRVVLTHAHLDHIEGVAALTRRLSAPVLLHPADR